MVHKNRFVVEHNMLHRQLLAIHIERNLTSIELEIQRMLDMQHIFNIIPALTRRQRRTMAQIT